MSQRAQRVSRPVMQATPRSSTSAPGSGSGAQKPNTVGSMSGSGAWLRPYSAPRETCRYT
jgi:hypothetical protein